MKGKTTRSAGAIPKSPRTSLGPSPGPMNRYIQQGIGEGEKQVGSKGRQIDTKEKDNKDKKGQYKVQTETSHLSEPRMEPEMGEEDRGKEEGQQGPQLPTKQDMEKMFAALENSLKAEMSTLHKDMGYMLNRVEEVEIKVDLHQKNIKELEDEIKKLKREQQEQSYKIEEQENRDKKKNLRIRGLPETEQAENLIEKMNNLFNQILGKETTNTIGIESVFRVKKPQRFARETSRDVIVRFEKWEEKKQIWINLKRKTQIEFAGGKLQIFQDLSQETLKRRRILKPLLEILREQEIQYNWGFPACLIARKNGISARLRHVEEIPDFCNKLEIPSPELEKYANSQERITARDDLQWQVNSRIRHQDVDSRGN